MATEALTKKRKPQDDGKPGKKQKKQKKVREDEGDLDMDAGLNRAFERMDGQLLADHIAQKTRRFGTDLSTVELSDLYISREYPSLPVPSGWDRGTDRTPPMKQMRSGIPLRGRRLGLWRTYRTF
jgi:protein CMS1